MNWMGITFFRKAVMVHVRDVRSNHRVKDLTLMNVVAVLLLLVLALHDALSSINASSPGLETALLKVDSLGTSGDSML
jgi:hypothetical protein